MWSMVSRRISRSRTRSLVKNDEHYDVEYGIDDDGLLEDGPIQTHARSGAETSESPCTVKRRQPT